jgi:hypothetical protein
MTSEELENLARAGKLKREPATQPEFDGLLRSGEARLKDARDPTLAQESRFDLAYNAAHALALAALRWHGFRADSRYIVFQVVPHTLGLGPEVWRVLDKCHGLRNTVGQTVCFLSNLSTPGRIWFYSSSSTRKGLEGRAPSGGRR